eukprot:PhM_4_TR11488/c0_g1_i1/m.56994
MDFTTQQQTIDEFKASLSALRSIMGSERPEAMLDAALEAISKQSDAVCSLVQRERAHATEDASRAESTLRRVIDALEYGKNDDVEEVFMDEDGSTTCVIDAVVQLQTRLSDLTARATESDAQWGAVVAELSARCAHLEADLTMERTGRETAVEEVVAAAELRLQSALDQHLLEVQARDAEISKLKTTIAEMELKVAEVNQSSTPPVVAAAPPPPSTPPSIASMLMSPTKQRVSEIQSFNQGKVEELESELRSRSEAFDMIRATMNKEIDDTKKSLETLQRSLQATQYENGLLRSEVNTLVCDRKYAQFTPDDMISIPAQTSSVVFPSISVALRREDAVDVTSMTYHDVNTLVHRFAELSRAHFALLNEPKQKTMEKIGQDDGAEGLLLGNSVVGGHKGKRGRADSEESLERGATPMRPPPAAASEAIFSPVRTAFSRDAVPVPSSAQHNPRVAIETATTGCQTTSDILGGDSVKRLKELISSLELTVDTQMRYIKAMESFLVCEQRLSSVVVQDTIPTFPCDELCAMVTSVNQRYVELTKENSMLAEEVHGLTDAELASQSEHMISDVFTPLKVVLSAVSSATTSLLQEAGHHVRHTSSINKNISDYKQMQSAAEKAWTTALAKCRDSAEQWSSVAADIRKNNALLEAEERARCATRDTHAQEKNALLEQLSAKEREIADLREMLGTERRAIADTLARAWQMEEQGAMQIAEAAAREEAVRGMISAEEGNRLRSALEALEKDMGDTRGALDAATRDNANLKQELGTIKNAHTSLLSAMQAQAADYQQKLSDCEERLATTTTTLDSTASELQNVKESAAATERRLCDRIDVLTRNGAEELARCGDPVLGSHEAIVSELTTSLDKTREALRVEGQERERLCAQLIEKDKRVSELDSELRRARQHNISEKLKKRTRSPEHHHHPSSSPSTGSVCNECERLRIRLASLEAANTENEAVLRRYKAEIDVLSHAENTAGVRACGTSLASALREERDAARAKITEHERTIEGFSIKESEWKAHVSDLIEKHKAELQGKCEEMEKCVHELQEQIGNVRAEVDEQKSLLKEKEKEYENLQKEKDNLFDDNVTLSKLVEKQNKKIEKLETQSASSFGVSL